MTQYDELNDQGDATSGYKTSEFVAAVVAFITHAIAFLVLLGYVAPADHERLMQTVTAIAGAAVTIAVNGAVVWKYIQSRTQIKTAAMEIRAELQMRMLNAESLRQAVRADEEKRK